MLKKRRSTLNHVILKGNPEWKRKMKRRHNIFTNVCHWRYHLECCSASMDPYGDHALLCCGDPSSLVSSFAIASCSIPSAPSFAGRGLPTWWSPPTSVSSMTTRGWLGLLTSSSTTGVLILCWTCRCVARQEWLERRYLCSVVCWGRQVG